MKRQQHQDFVKSHKGKATSALSKEWNLRVLSLAFPPPLSQSNEFRKDAQNDRHRTDCQGKESPFKRCQSRRDSCREHSQSVRVTMTRENITSTYTLFSLLQNLNVCVFIHDICMHMYVDIQVHLPCGMCVEVREQPQMFICWPVSFSSSHLTIGAHYHICLSMGDQIPRLAQQAL